MSAIRLEQDTQQRVMLARKQALDAVIADLNSLRSMGKEIDANTPSRPSTPTPDNPAQSSELGTGVSLETGQLMDASLESGEVDEMATDTMPPPAVDRLNPAARVFVPSPLHTTRILQSSDDVEMGEVSEDKNSNKTKKKLREELEEGEASDTSSALTDLPED